MLWRPHTDIALKWLWNTYPSRNHLAARINRFPINYLLQDVEAPDNSTDVQIQGLLCDMDARTNSSSCAVREVIALIWVSDVEV